MIKTEKPVSSTGFKSPVRGGDGRSRKFPSAPGGTRTPNLLIRSQTLYPLSYGRIGRIISHFSIKSRHEDLFRLFDNRWAG